MQSSTSILHISTLEDTSGRSVHLRCPKRPKCTKRVVHFTEVYKIFCTLRTVQPRYFDLADVGRHIIISCFLVRVISFEDFAHTGWTSILIDLLQALPYPQCGVTWDDLLGDRPIKCSKYNGLSLQVCLFRTLWKLFWQCTHQTFGLQDDDNVLLPQAEVLSIKLRQFVAFFARHLAQSVSIRADNVWN